MTTSRSRPALEEMIATDLAYAQVPQPLSYEELGPLAA